MHTEELVKEVTAANKGNQYNISVIRRDGNLVDFDSTRISLAMLSAFEEVKGKEIAASSSIHDLLKELTDIVVAKVKEKSEKSSNKINVEYIQDIVELSIMRHGLEIKDPTLFDVARAYIIYRNEHKKIREANSTTTNTGINLTLADGTQIPLDRQSFDKLTAEACEDLAETNPSLIVDETLRNLFNGISEKEARDALVMTARTHIENEPNYSYVAARLLLSNAAKEASECLKVRTIESKEQLFANYGRVLKATIEFGVKQDRISKDLLDFDFNRLSAALKPERDLQFSYLGLQTLYDRYFLHHQEKRFELPQTFFMRVAMGLALMETDKNAKAIEFYEVLSAFDFMSSTPTLFNSGTVRSQLSSCYLTTIPDDLLGIYDGIKDNAMLSKFAGGLGNDWTPVRSMGAYIKGTNGKSQGVVPFMKVANDTAVAVNQGGKRKGVACAYLETWHMDIEEFLELRKNTGDERRRTHDMNTANWIPDLFMQRVLDNQEWTLFSPNDVPDLHEIYGSAFNNAYLRYERMAADGKIKHFKKLPAVSLWRKMLSMLFETGHPWITFKDPCNLRSPQQHSGVVHSSNLCTEITLNTSPDEIAVCNLGSINLARHVNSEGLDVEKLKRTVSTAIRMLDNVIDINFYPVDKARRSNLRHRPIGLGLMGFQDALYKLDISYQSDAAVKFADNTMEYISYYAISSSCELAKERGSYATFEGSLWSKGILPIDSISLLQKSRGKYLEQDQTQTLDWQSLRQSVKINGMRNSNVLAIAPTATISNICGVSQSIEPTYQNLFVKSNLSGEFTIVNPYLVKDLKEINLWDKVMVNDLKYYNGSLSKISRIPENIKSKYLTAFEIAPKWLIECASRRQKWIDQAQSLNLYIATPSGKKLDDTYKLAWSKGLKTTYYLRSLGATDTEKSTVDKGVLNAVKSSVVNACSIDDPDCESCQ